MLKNMSEVDVKWLRHCAKRNKKKGYFLEILSSCVVSMLNKSWDLRSSQKPRNEILSLEMEISAETLVNISFTEITASVFYHHIIMHIQDVHS